MTRDPQREELLKLIAVQKKRQEVHNEFAAHQSQLAEAVL